MRCNDVLISANDYEVITFVSVVVGKENLDFDVYSLTSPQLAT